MLVESDLDPYPFYVAGGVLYIPKLDFTEKLFILSVVHSVSRLRSTSPSPHITPSNFPETPIRLSPFCSFLLLRCSPPLPRSFTVLTPSPVS